VPNVRLRPNDHEDSARAFNASHFTVLPMAGTHVLLLDDTWTTGGHLQSASAALKAAGVRQVTGLAIARWLDPSWHTTRSFIDELIEDFDPKLCPYTGAPC
jgi:hypothetical protein